MQDRPDSIELLKAVSEFLERDLLSVLEARAQFHTHVAINVLGIVVRELRNEEEAVGREWQRLAGLLDVKGDPPSTFDEMRHSVGDMNAELSRGIRSGDMDTRINDVVAAVKATVFEKLGIANPKYAKENG